MASKSPSSRQKKFWDALSKEWEKTRKSDGFEDIAVKMAKEMGLTWEDIADMSNNEEHFRKGPAFVLRMTRNKLTI